MPTTPPAPRLARPRTPSTTLRGRLPVGDGGVAMVMVLGTAMVLTALVVATLALTVNGVRSARGDQDWQAALPAAEAGVDHYLSRLNEDGTYWKFGNPAAPFSATSAAQLTLPTGPATNPAFTTWTEVPGSSGRAQFRYAVDTSGFFTSGVIRVQSTGRVGDRTRTVETSIGRRNFIDYLYFTDIEAKDPALYSTAVAPPDSMDSQQAFVSCNRHLYQRDSAGSIRLDRVNSDVANSPNGCTNIVLPGAGGTPYFSGDTINGPFHSNDAVHVCRNPVLTAEATTSYDGSLTSGRRYIRNNSCSTTSTPQIASAGNNFTYAAPLTLPPTNGALSLQVDPAHTGGAAPGCLYTGPTRIVFRANGTMDVTSPWSQNGGAAWCGVGTGRPLPARGVIWVRNVPATADAYSRTTPSLQAGASCNASNNPLGYPQTFGTGSSARKDRTPYGCWAGDAIVSGDVTGQVTVGSENNIVVADDTRYADASCAASTTCTSILGLISNNSVETMHPWGCRSDNTTCGNLTTAQDDLVIEAAILSVQHSFRVQNAAQGSAMGTLTVRGAIGQKYRGTVGLQGSGYSKNYNYDWRLRYASPPYFLDPVKSSFGRKTWSEPQAAYPATAP